MNTMPHETDKYKILLQIVLLSSILFLLRKLCQVFNISVVYCPYILLITQIIQSVICSTLPVLNTSLAFDVNMELSQNPDWRLTKSVLVLLGLWPFQQTYLQVLLSRVVIILLISIIIPETIKMICVWGDVNAITECATLLSLHLVSMVKMLGYYFYLHKLKIVLEDIQKHWRSNLSLGEIKIMQHYGLNNRRLTYAYACIIFGITIVILGTPLAPKILDYIIPLNESRAIFLLYSTEYFVDPVKYKVSLFMHAYLISPFPSLVTIAFDTSYFHCVQHSCSMFAIMRHQIQIITDQTGAKMYKDVTDKEKSQLLADCIKRHVVILQYCEKLESLYNLVLLPVIVINTLALSVIGFHTLMKLNDPLEAFKSGSFAFTCMVHLFFFTYTGQDLANHSDSIHQVTYDSIWYNMSPKLRVFFILTMIRSSKTCRITAGKLYILSIENFGKVMKLSISYFTVLLSFQ